MDAHMTVSDILTTWELSTVLKNISALQVDNNSIYFIRSHDNIGFKLSIPPNYPNNDEYFVITKLDNQEDEIILKLLDYIYSHDIHISLNELLDKVNSMMIKPSNINVTNEKINEWKYINFGADDNFMDFYQKDIEEKKDMLQENIWKQTALKTINSLPTNKQSQAKISLNLIINELKQNTKKFNISLINNDVYNWIIKLDKIEFQLIIHQYLYPYYPPSIKFLRPRLANGFIYAVSNMKYLRVSNWNPTNTMFQTISNIKNILEKYAVFNDSDKTNPLEDVLIQLASLSEIPPNDSNKYDIKIEYVEIKDSVEKSDTYWAAGTGYGHSGQKATTWDIEATKNNEIERERRLNSLLDDILQYIKNYDKEMDNIINESCLIPFIVTKLKMFTLNDIEITSKNYMTIFNIMMILYDKIPGMFTDQIITLIQDVNKQCEMFMKTSDDRTHNDFINIVKKTNEIIKKQVNKSNNKMMILTAYPPEEREYKYCEYMKPLQVEIINLFDKQYNYRTHLTSNLLPTARSRLSKELSSYDRSLPLSLSSSIFVRIDERYMNALKVLIIGPKDTPYENGCFDFDFLADVEYPNKAPLVNFNTNGSGSFRFNPNLYAEGKVCLSLLGTWEGKNPGESWNPATSTLLQVMISIQSLILIDHPYFNEPGHERNYGTSDGIYASKKYNIPVKYHTVKLAMLGQLEKPAFGFEEVIQRHFFLKKDEILEQLEKWQNDMNGEYIGYFKKEANKLREKLG